MTWSLSEIQPSKCIENRSRYLICGQPARFMQLKLVHQLNQLCLLTQDPFNFSPLYCTTQFVDLQLHLSGSHKKKKSLGTQVTKGLKRHTGRGGRQTAYFPIFLHSLPHWIKGR